MNKHRIKDLLRKDEESQKQEKPEIQEAATCPWWPSSPLNEEERIRMNALNVQWLAAYEEQNRIVRAMIEIFVEKERRKWRDKNPLAPDEQFSFPVGADLPMYQNKPK